jgi:hypothetical protein
VITRELTPEQNRERLCRIAARQGAILAQYGLQSIGTNGNALVWRTLSCAQAALEALEKPTVNTNDTETGMRDVWSWALSWFRKPPSSPAKRLKQAQLVAIYLEMIRDAEDVPSLHAHYCADSRWALTAAKALFPREWPTLGIHATTAAAFGVRYVELMTGARLDPLNLPQWTSEWAIW